LRRAGRRPGRTPLRPRARVRSRGRRQGLRPLPTPRQCLAAASCPGSSWPASVRVCRPSSRSPG
jgi:hypothetical protein